MNKSGLNAGSSRLIIPIVLYISLVVFLVLMFDSLSRDICKFSIDTQSQTLDFSLQNYSQTSSRFDIDEVTDLIKTSCTDNLIAIKILSPECDVICDEKCVDSIENIPHLYSKSFSVSIDNLEYLIVLSYDCTLANPELKNKMQIIFVISSIIAAIILFFCGVMLYSNSNPNKKNRQSDISKDTLINVYSNQDFKDNILREASRMRRLGGILSVICIDIDDFDSGKFSDNLKDNIRQSTLQLLFDNIRIFDFIGQFDNYNTIFVCMIDANEQNSIDIATRFAKSCRESKYFIDGHVEITVTVSAGVASLQIPKMQIDKPEVNDVTADDIDGLFNRCSLALTAAHNRGNDSIVGYSSINSNAKK